MFTTFNAGGNQYELRFTINALCEFENKYNIGVTEAIMNSKSFYYLRGLLWAGLIANHKVTVEQTGEIMDAYLGEDHEFGDLIKMLTEALQAAGFFRTNGSAGSKKAAAPGKSAK